MALKIDKNPRPRCTRSENNSDQERIALELSLLNLNRTSSPGVSRSVVTTDFKSGPIKKEFKRCAELRRKELPSGVC